MPCGPNLAFLKIKIRLGVYRIFGRISPCKVILLTPKILRWAATLRLSRDKLKAKFKFCPVDQIQRLNLVFLRFKFSRQCFLLVPRFPSPKTISFQQLWSLAERNGIKIEILNLYQPQLRTFKTSLCKSTKNRGLLVAHKNQTYEWKKLMYDISDVNEKVM